MEYVTAQGVEVPALGFGTASSNLDHDEHRRAVLAALDVGYRHIDTAQMYKNERAIGEAVAESEIDRGELFITTKLDGGNRDYDTATETTHASLDRLAMDYVDLLLIHYPNDEVPHAETLEAMNDLHDDGYVRHVGVSNFSVAETREAIELSDTPILTNQVKYHPRYRQDDLLELCIDENVMLTAYSPVAHILDEPLLAEIGERHDKTAAQISIRWLLQQPMVSTPPQSSSAHIRENFEVLDFALSDAEMREIFALEGPLDDSLAAKLGL